MRYRYDEASRTRIKTAEIFVEKIAWTPPARKFSDNVLVPVQIAFTEEELKAAAKSAKGRWNPDVKLWYIRYVNLKGTMLEKHNSRCQLLTAQQLVIYHRRKMMKNKLFILLPLVLLVIISVSYVDNCYAGNSSIKILEIDPKSSTPLKSGSKIHFKVKLEYDIVDDSAVVNLIFQKGEDSGSFDSVVGSTMQVISKGKGTLKMEKTVKVPDTNALQVFTPLMIPGQTQTTTVDMKVYKVIK